MILLGFAVRWPHLNQSLWYDEMTTLGDYVQQPWSKVLAAGAGEYVPNNHVLHTVLVKLIYSTGPDGPREWLLRVPACIAGLIVPLALAWPLRAKNPLMALAVAVVAAVHPWLMADSCEARGYTLMLLLGLLATNCLPVIKPVGKPTSSIPYIVLITLAIYTVPLAVMLIPGHAIAMWFLRRSGFLKWVLAAVIAMLLAGFLYLPMAAGMISYYRNPFLATLDYRGFLDALPRYALMGMRRPMHSDPLWFGSEPFLAGTCWAVPVLIIIFGTAMGWVRVALRPLLITLGTASLLGILLPLVTRGSTEPRFVQWMLPWFCISAVALLMAAKTRTVQIVAGVGAAALLGTLVSADITMPPNQPIREAMHLADQLAPPGRDILFLYGGSAESVTLYRNQVPHHHLLAALTADQMLRAQQRAIDQTGHLPWIVIIYEKIALSRDLPGNEEHGLWRSLAAHYHLAVPRMVGRVSPIAIYAPNQDQ